MKLTTKSEYSVLALIYLTRNGTDKYVRLEEICAEYDISKKYLEALIAILKHNNYIKTKRGANGGYKLARSPDKISLAEIIRLMDGALAPTESVSVYFYADTPISKEKKVLKEFKDIRDYVANKLEKLKLSDLV